MPTVPGLHKIAIALVAPGKGILAADESIATMSRRLEAAGVVPSGETRRESRRLLLTTPSLAHWVAGIILSEETLGQDLPDGTPFGEAAAALEIMAGIKVDKGVTALPFSDGGLVTEGLDGLRGRLDAYRQRGAGRAFLSGGQSNARACANLAAISARAAAPWRLTFSFGRALVQDALGAWRGAAANVAAAQNELGAIAGASAGRRPRVRSPRIHHGGVPAAPPASRERQASRA